MIVLTRPFAAVLIHVHTRMYACTDRNCIMTIAITTSNVCRGAVMTANARISWSAMTNAVSTHNAR